MDNCSGIGSEKTLLTRRSGPDWLQKTMLWLAVCCWLLFLLALILFNYARPDIQFGYLSYLNIEVRDTWRSDIKTLLTYVLWSCCALSFLTIILNHLRSRRKNDHPWYNLILLLVVTLAAIMSLTLFL